MNGPFVMVIFGATGDLAKSKLIPSLFSLFKQRKLPKDFFILGFSRRKMSDSGFRDYFTPLRQGSAGQAWKEFAKHLFYQQGNFEEKEGYEGLISELDQIDKKIGACVTRFFYLATPPQHYETILNFLYSTKLYLGCGAEGQSENEDFVHTGKWTRLIIEKPFGKDLESARALDKRLSEIFDEKQIFRVDHYLAKETVQNMIAFRFANGVFEPVWNKNFIDHVQITFAEKEGIGGRGKFFDGVGMLRDVGQNHLMQLLGAVAMEQPRSFTKEDIRDVRAKVVSAIREGSSGSVVRGQYKGYRDEKDVLENSNTETFVAMKLFIDTPRFEGVPFYLRAGKGLSQNSVYISIVFIQTCHVLFKEYGCPEIGNVLTIRIQPDEGINLRVIAKKPGPTKLSLDTVNMHFSYQGEFGGKGVDAYEKILMDIFSGDQILFNRSDELESSWRFITAILNKWKDEKTPVPSYEKGSWGPKEAEELIEKDNRKWL